MALYPSLRWSAGLLILGLMVPATPAQPAAPQPTTRAIIIIEYQPSGNPPGQPSSICQNIGYPGEIEFNGRTPTAYSCDDNHTQIPFNFTSAEYLAYTGFPVENEGSEFPEWAAASCLPYWPGPFLINTCDASKEPIASKGGQTSC